MARELEGKVAVVTGASRGLGRAIAELFAAEGAQLALIDLKQHWVQAVADDIAAKGVNAIALAADVSNQAALRAAMDKTGREFGRIDILVNNAMWNRYDPIDEITPETFQRMAGVGMGGIVWGIQSAIQHMKDGGSIINIGSMAGRLGSPSALLYSGVKAGVDGMTRAASIELGALGIRVNAIAPSTVATEGVKAILTPEMFADRVAKSPLGRLGEERDIAQAALWLAGERATFVTGQSLAVDGGIGHAFYR
ncbi:SDR family oxidoreductase [Novosphingobium sp.]|uniref:SDR family NAD(P)-dependent oxidoreductase n=1 Tax=Novosphingobium sp. TaxID=1874826 RepID=UPI001ED6DA97|nr:SDR family oxidoreductase [Novosphingobium sp.]MBK9010182.1 SDR family oxidoreductase [Novosphingobium sp.]